jgi:hypothetical protein
LSLENADGGCERAVPGFAEEQVDVLGHEDVAEDEEVMSLAEPFEGLEEDGAGVIVVEVG